MSVLLVFEDSKQCASISLALTSLAKRRIIEVLSRGPMTLDVLASLTGVSDVLIRDVVGELESCGMVEVVEVEEEGVKEVFAKVETPVYYKREVEGLDGLVEEASRRMLDAFLQLLDERRGELEEVFNKNGGRYTLSSLVMYCFALAAERAHEELKEGRDDEYVDAMKAWVREKARAAKSRRS